MVASRTNGGHRKGHHQIVAAQRPDCLPRIRPRELPVPVMANVLPEAWQRWYRLARDQLELENGEAVEYANARYVEEENRARRGPARPLPEREPAHDRVRP